MYRREAQQKLQELATHYSVISLTGPRQSGKTTLCKLVFPEKKYVSLEDLDFRSYAKDDPRGFLNQSKNGLIIDEIQNCPELFSYLQGIVDEKHEPGKFILTGSQQFGLLNGINQSLAGRVGLLELLPFSINEIKKEVSDLNDLLLKGLYPPIYDKKIPPEIWYSDYLKTYIERDVRNLINVKDLSSFKTFLGLCAARAGQLINFAELSNASGIDVRTVRSWISVLEASYIIFILPPYHKNFSKRLVKSPKIYFYDAGLLTHLLRLRKEDLTLSPYRGSIFEVLIMSEFFKFNKHHRKNLDFYFWRDHKGREIDLVFEFAGKTHAVEIKSGETIQDSFFENLTLFRKFLEEDLGKSYLVYGGRDSLTRKDVSLLSWKNTQKILKEF